MISLHNELLQLFQPISLEEMDKVAFMNRVDTKYVFNSMQLKDILQEASKQYRILEVNSVRQHLYDSLYFDTPDYQMYYWHLYKRLNRYKIRFRKYVNSNGLTFLEIKFKDNKEKTYKKRKQYNDILPYIPNELTNFIETKTPFSAKELLPVLQIRYYRMTLVSNNLNERVTIDTHLSFNNFSTATSFDNIVIAEVKRSNYSDKTTFIKLLKQFGIKEGGLSKYCTGMALNNNLLKKNNFLPILKQFQKINQI